jgi:hypothetical protein
MYTFNRWQKITKAQRSTVYKKYILYVKLYHLYHIICTGVDWTMVMQKVPLHEINYVQCTVTQFTVSKNYVYCTVGGSNSDNLWITYLPLFPSLFRMKVILYYFSYIIMLLYLYTCIWLIIKLILSWIIKKYLGWSGTGLNYGFISMPTGGGGGRGSTQPSSGLYVY